MNLNSTDIAALLGATAWIPQIAGWIYNAFSKPVVTIIPDKSASIGYTTFGPIFNLRLSISADKKDTLIDFIGIKLQHQDGSKHNFEWIGMTEFFSEVKSNKGENQLIQRDIVPISIKLSTLSLVERFFRFQDSSFLETSRPVVNSLIDYQQYMRKNDKNYHDQFLKSKNFDDYLKFMRENFWWKKGKYILYFYIRSPAKITFVKNLFEFELTQNDIDFLGNNLEEIKKEIEFMIKKPDLPDFSGQMGVWGWKNPILKKIHSRKLLSLYF